MAENSMRGNYEMTRGGQTMKRGLGLKWKILLILGAVVLSLVLAGGVAYAVTF